MSVAPRSACNLVVSYTPSVAPSNSSGVLSVGAAIGNTKSFAVSLAGEGVTPPTGTITSTANPYVAQYTLTAPAPGQWSVSFGPTGTYGRTTSPQNASTAGVATSIYVAGMLAGSVNHMRATFTFANGVAVNDVDHVFTAGAAPSGVPSFFPVSSTGTPQPGVELIDPVNGDVAHTAMATDLAGNIIWAYPFADADANSNIAPVKLLNNGHMLAIAAAISFPIGLTSATNDLREFDLAGALIRRLTMAQLNAALAAAGFPLKANVFSHDFVTLPNGHTLVIVTTDRVLTDLPGYPGQTDVAGDAVVDLDPDWKPVWVWNEFDHLDVNRHPYLFPDWTHSNSLAYSQSDGDFVISLRHQNWVIKVNYQDGRGDGSIVWRLGEGGDFRLVNGTDPHRLVLRAA